MFMTNSNIANVTKNNAAMVTVTFDDGMIVTVCRAKSGRLIASGGFANATARHEVMGCVDAEHCDAATQAASGLI